MTDESSAVEPTKLILRILERLQDDLHGVGEDVLRIREELKQQGVGLSGRLDAVERTLVELASQQRTTLGYVRDLRDRVRDLELETG